MNRTIATTTGVVIVALALVACSSTPSDTPARKAAPVETGQTNERVYSSGQLASILDSVNSTLGLGGSVTSGSGATNGSLNAVDVLLTQPGTSFTPAACIDFATSDGRNLLAFSGPDAVSAMLTSSQLNLIAIAASGTTLPTGFRSGFESAANSTLAACPTVKARVRASGAPSSITIATVPVSANAGSDSTVAFKESSVISGSGTSTSSWTTIEAIDGNLELFVSGVSTQDVPSLEKAIDAAIAAAKQ